MKRLLPGAGYDIHETADGVSLSINPAEPADTDHPFKVRLSGLKFKVTAGTVNSKMPTLDGTALDAGTAPEKTISSTGHVYLKCAHSSGAAFPNTVTVEYASSVPADDDTYGYVDIATITVTSGAAKKTSQAISTSLYGDRLKCGSDPAAYYFSRV